MTSRVPGRTSRRGQEPGRRRPWQAALVERGLSALVADYRRPGGPVVIAAVLAVTALPVAVRSEPGPLGPAVPALALAATVPIAVIRRFPVRAIAVIAAASAVFLLVGRLDWPPSAIAGWLAAVAAAPVLFRRAAAIGVFVLAELVVAAAALPALPSATPWDASLAEALAVIAAWGAGETLRSRRQAAADRAAAAARERALSEGAGVARERAAMARELHDVVAHHVSMIAVRAATAPYAIAGLPGPGQDAFADIAREARQAMAELRVVLGVLRDPAAAPEAAPQPGLSDLATLLGRARGAGARITQTVTGTARPLSAPVELCAYRIVQESVTNAGRHAPGGDVAVTIGYRADALTVTVASTAGSGPPAPGSPPGPGFGLLGLRERVAILDGQITAGPQDGGGFLVTAMLPASPACAPAGQAAR